MFAILRKSSENVVVEELVITFCHTYAALHVYTPTHSAGMPKTAASTAKVCDIHKIKITLVESIGVEESAMAIYHTIQHCIATAYHKLSDNSPKAAADSAWA